VVASGAVDATDSSRDEGPSTLSAFASSERTSSTRADALVNRVVDAGLAKLTPQFESRLQKVPFRVKVVTVDSAGVVINAGTTLGVSVGDTFGVRSKAQVLTDPDSGELLSEPGVPIGLVRVAEVSEKTARAQVLAKSMPLMRGDELEWVGVYRIVSAR
jgi:hypothetical protein